MIMWIKVVWLITFFATVGVLLIAGVQHGRE